MKSIMRKAAAYGLVLAMGCTSLAGCGKNGAKIDGSKTLMTVNGEDLRMGVASFYTRFQQAQMYQFYSMYFGSGAAIFDTVEDEATGKTYGDDIKEEVLSELEKLVIINQHADEFGVSLTDEQKANITAAAEAYIASNDQAVLDKVGAAKEDVEKLLTLQTVQSLMMDPIVKDVDREVPDEDAQQTTLTYVAVNVAEDETSETSEAEAQSEAAVSEATTSEATTSEATTSESTTSEATAESETAVSEATASETSAVESEAAVSETAAVESEAAASETAAVESEAAASETAAVESETAESEEEETEAQKAARADAEAILEAVMAESMIAEADMDAIARTVDDTYYAATGQFTTNDPADADVDSSVAEAAAGLEDGELVDHVVKSADGTRYYVVRVDHVFDEEATAEKKKSIIEERKQTLYDETTDGWVESADIKVDENVWKTLTLTDMEPVTLKAPEVQSEAESAESAVSEQETAESTVSSAAAAAESTVSSAAETAESTVSSAAAESTVSSAAEAADSAVTSAVETAESTVASVAAAVDSAAESAAGTAAAVESKVEAAAEELESTVEGLESAAETAVNEYEDAVASTVEEAAAEAVSVAEAVENTVTSTVSAAEAAVSQAAETANTAAASSGKTNAAAEAAAAAAAAAAADLSGSAAK